MGYVVKASNIADYLNSSLSGKDIDISMVTSLSDIQSNTIAFSKKTDFEIDVDISSLILVPLNYQHKKDHVSVIKVKNPRLAFAKVLDHFFVKKTFGQKSKSSIIGNNCIIDTSVSIGENSVIEDNVKIGANSIINHNVVIHSNTVIGNNCYIKSGTIIGEDGFGFDFEEDGTPVRIPHLGSVIIGDNVEIGAKNTIARGTLDNTVIESYVKIDDQVHIAHNCKIGRNTIITACAEISGSVTVGKNCWIGPNCSIMQKVKIGNGVTIGIGAVVVSNVESNKKVMGLDALDLRKLLKLKKRIEFGK